MVTAGIDVGVIAVTDTGATLNVSTPGQTDLVSDDLINLGTLAVDTGYGEGGTTLTIGGTLGNANLIQIGGFGGVTAATTVSADALNNAGSIELFGGNTEQATLNIASAAPTMFSRNVQLNNDACCNLPPVRSRQLPLPAGFCSTAPTRG